MIFVSFFIIYIIIWFIVAGILRALDTFEDFEVLLFGLIWPISIIITILIAIAEISEKVTRKILEKWE